MVAQPSQKPFPQIPFVDPAGRLTKPYIDYLAALDAAVRALVASGGGVFPAQPAKTFLANNLATPAIPRALDVPTTMALLALSPAPTNSVLGNIGAPGIPAYLTQVQLQALVGGGPFKVVIASGGDDTAAINAALAIVGVGTVWLTSSNYLVSGQLNIPAGTSLVAMGIDGTSITATGGQAVVVSMQGVIRATLRDLTIKGACGIGVLIRATTGHAANENMVQRVYVDGLDASGNMNVGIQLDFTGTGTGYFNRVQNCQINLQHGDSGIKLIGAHDRLGPVETDLSFINIGCSRTTNYGVHADSVDYFAMTRVEVLAASANGMYIIDSSVDATDCLSDSSLNDNWVITGTPTSGPIATSKQAFKLNGCWAGAGGSFDSVTGTGPNPAATGFFVHGTSGQLIGCNSGANQSYGIQLGGDGSAPVDRFRYVVSGCNITDNNQQTADPAHPKEGLYANNCLVNITGNFSGTTGAIGAQQQPYGFTTDTGAAGVLVANTGRGNTTANIQNNSVSVQAVANM